MIEITKRMKLIANTVTKGNVVADIGCDHGYVSIYLIKQDISPKVIAMDLREGPLKKAKTNTRQSNDKKVIENIEFRISNGFEKLKPKVIELFKDRKTYDLNIMDCQKKGDVTCELVHK